MKKLYGVITAMPTPFDAKGCINVEAIEKLTDFLIKKKVNCLYPCGTTGEMYLMTAEERELVAETVIKKAARRVPVFIHTGAMREEETLRLSLHAVKAGADGIGIVTPSFFKLSDRAMVRYFCEITSALPADFPVYAYNIPQLSGNEISADVLDEITTKHKNIIGIKYSFPDMNRLLQYLNLKNRSLSVVFGPDQLFLPAMLMGCDGIVSGCSSALPEIFVDLYQKIISGDLEAAKNAGIKATLAVRFIQSGFDLANIKAVLNARGIPIGHMRKPLPDLTEEEKIKTINYLEPFYKAEI